MYHLSTKLDLKSRRSSLVAGIFVSVLAMGQALAGPAAVPSAALTAKAPEAAALAADAAKGPVKVIITLKMPAGAATASTSAAGDAAIKANVKSVVDPFLSQVLGIQRTASASSTSTAGSSSTKAAPTTGDLPAGVKVMPFLPMIATSVSAADLERIAADGRVASITRDTINYAQLTQSVPLIGADQAFNAGATGSGRMVAILDTGVQYSHPFFGNRVTNATCHSTTGSGYTTLCPNGQASQYGGNAGVNCTGNNDCFHGTHVAGIAAGNLAGNTPPRGVSPASNIFAVQVFSRPASGRLGAFTSDMIAGMQDIYNERTTLNIASLNMSIGGGSFTSACDGDPRAAVIQQLRAGGVAVVISSGNDGSVNAVSAPGCISAAITVGSTEKNDTISSFSNMSSMVDVMAPGGSIVSSVPTSVYGTASGTSMAAPHVTGAVAALKSAVPSATVDQIETALEQTGVSIVDNRSGGTITKPRINVYLALLRLLGAPNPPGNDNFVSAFSVVPAALDPTVVTGTNVSASLQTGEPRGNASVQGTVWWKFTAARTESMRIRTAGSAIDTTLGVYRGTSVGALTQVAFNDDTNGSLDRTSTVVFNTTAGTIYYVQVGGFSSARGALSVTFDHSPPANDNFASAQLLAQPTSGTIALTANNNFATLETGEPKFTPSVNRTLWYRFVPTVTKNYAFNTTGSAFDTTLALYRGTALNALTLVASSDDYNGTAQSRLTSPLLAGTTYYVQAGGFGAARGALKLNYAGVGPANDMFAAAAVLTGSPGIVSGTNVNASVEAGEFLAIQQIGATAWWRFTATTTKTVDISTVGSSFDTVLSVFYPGGAKGLQLVTFNDDDGGVVTSRVRFSAVSGRTYYIQVGGYGTATGNVSLSFPTGTPLAMRQAAN